MKKLTLIFYIFIIIGSFFLIFGGLISPKSDFVSNAKNDLMFNNYYENYSSIKVYVCLGKYAKRYHLYKYCDGLDNCKGDIFTMLKSEAESMDRTLCSRCRKIQNNKRQ